MVSADERNQLGTVGVTGGRLHLLGQRLTSSSETSYMIGIRPVVCLPSNAVATLQK